MRFIGDVHTKFEQYNKIKNQSEKSFQVGDFGFGFREVPDIFRPTDRLILGNHDDPTLGRKYPNHVESGSEWEGIFAFNGAASSDRIHRIEGRDWWSEEEHSYSEIDQILQKWEDSECDTVVAHDCPTEIYPLIAPITAMMPQKRDKLSHRWVISESQNFLFLAIIISHLIL